MYTIYYYHIKLISYLKPILYNIKNHKLKEQLIVKISSKKGKTITDLRKCYRKTS